MKKLLYILLFVPLLGVSQTSETDLCNETPIIFEYTGSPQSFIVPAGVNLITVRAYGAEGEDGGNGEGGLGGYVSAEISVYDNDTLNIYVGGTGNIGGYNGGGAPNDDDGGGGGATDIRINGSQLSDRIIVAGGGGGGGDNCSGGWNEPGGAGGGLIGGNGIACSSGGAGLGGTQTSGGNGGGPVGTYNESAENGMFGVGGAPRIGDIGCCGAGGGGGYYGGGGGAYSAGGGGSSYTTPDAFNVIHEQGVNSGNGFLIIEHCQIMYPGCTDSLAFNFIYEANTDDGSCEYSGCMNSNAINFDETATIDDEETCIYSQEYVHGLWNEVDDGLIQYNESVESLSSLQQALETWNTTIDLSAGWNMFGYGCPTSIDLVQGLSNHTELIAMVKDNNGSAYRPEFGFNGIGDFTPGFGYQIKITEPIEGFSLCDWYVNDIPEDNIVSLQEENASLQDSIEFLNSLPIYQIGDMVEGGIVFYVDETGEHGLVAAQEDLEGFYEWGCYGEYVDGAVSKWIDSGLQNTMVITNQGCATENGGITAAQAALDAEINGYSDWYLPSIGELYQMYITIGEGSENGNLVVEGDSHWSSTERFNNIAWNLIIPGGQMGSIYKSFLGSVRVIRSF